MKLAVCQVLLSLDRGGAEILAGRISRRLAGSHRFVFVCLADEGELAPELRAEGFAVHVLGKRAGVDLRVVARLRSLVRAERIDVVHAHQYGPFFYSALARLPWRSPPIVFTEHGRLHPDPRRPAHPPANRALLRRHDRVVGVGEAARRALIDVEGFAPARVEVVFNGVDAPAFDVASRDEVRRELGLGPDDFVVLMAARLDPIKDHATALRAIARAARAREGVKLLLAGDGPARSGVEATIARLRIGDVVRVLGTRRDVPRLVAASDLGLLTSVSEGIPLALLEPMAAGIPVVATRVGGVPEVVLDGVSGLLAPAGDDAAIAGMIEALAGDPSRRRSMGSAARERARNVFSEAAMVDRYRRLYAAAARGERA
ncbi:MAG: glycosyltransferase [Labilithrix sp.]|nr:glycosyltransferase [Labilithrix sp.]MCW5814166.1 glycosyltransferase [Labilithrix sp.]